MPEYVSLNLLTERKRKLRKQRMVVARIQVVTGVILGVYVALLVVLFGIRGGVALGLSSVKNSIEEEQFAIAQMEVVERLYLALHTKLDTLADFLAGNPSSYETVNKIIGLMPEGLQLESINYARGEPVTATFQAPSVFVMVEYLNVIEEAALLDEDISVIEVSGLSRSPEGTYSINNNFELVN